MFQGTGSDVGKSLIVAGLCRAFTRRGLRVRPFKPQNMSNNAAVTDDGGEIGRAQALQARACGVSPSVHMNPVLLKPQSEVGAQVVVQGKVIGNAPAREYQALKPKLMGAVLDSYAHVKAKADLVLVEGAGSAAEINLREGDIANMGFARAAGCPVALVGDIDRGGIFAQILGVKAALAPEDAATIVGFIVNKFRGDANLFLSGMMALEAHTHWRAFGLLPFFADAARLPAEDAFSLGDKKPRTEGAVTIAVPMLARIANFDDFDPLRMEPSVRLVFVRPASRCRSPILSSCRAARRRSPISNSFASRAGISTSSPMRGVADEFSESAAATRCWARACPTRTAWRGRPGEIEGLKLLDVATVLTGEKTLRQVEGACLTNGAPFRGYEMHVGETKGPDCARPLLRFADGQLDGAVSRKRPDRRRLCAWAVRRRSPARGVARGARNDAPESTTSRRSSARSTRSPTIARRISIATRCLRPRARVHWDELDRRDRSRPKASQTVRAPKSRRQAPRSDAYASHAVSDHHSAAAWRLGWPRCRTSLPGRSFPSRRARSRRSPCPFLRAMVPCSSTIRPDCASTPRS